MIDVLTPGVPARAFVPNSSLPQHFLNCYEILNSGDLAQPVNLYAVDFKDVTRNAQENRGELKKVIWSLRKQHRSSSSGYGFVVDI
jgi:hypothetical protein